MPLPLLLPLAAGAARLGAGAAVRGIAGKVVGQQAANSVKGRVASQAVGNYGVNAIQRGVQNRPEPKQDHGITQRIRENPGETLAGAAYMVSRTPSLADNAMSQTNSLLQSTQFSQTP